MLVSGMKFFKNLTFGRAYVLVCCVYPKGSPHKKCVLYVLIFLLRQDNAENRISIYVKKRKFFTHENDKVTEML